MAGSSPVRLHWRARQRDVDTGEGPRGYRRYPRRYRRYLRDDDGLRRERNAVRLARVFTPPIHT